MAIGTMDPRPSLALHNREWLSRFLSRLRLKPLTGALALAAINLLTEIPLSFMFGAWYPCGRTRGLSSEPATWVYDFLVAPIAVGYFLWVQTSGDRVLQAMVGQGPIKASPEEVEGLLSRKITWLQSGWPSIVASSIGLVYTGWYLLVTTSTLPTVYATWTVAHPLLPWLRAPALFITLYALLMAAMYIGTVVYALRSLMREYGVHVNPAEPDNAGGMGAVGRFAASLGVGVGAIGLALSVDIVQSWSQWGVSPVTTATVNYGALTGVAVYLVVAPILFFVPIWSSHRAMVRFRDSMLRAISEDYRRCVDEVMGVEVRDLRPKDEILEEIVELDEMQTVLRQFPTWPFNLGNLGRYFGFVICPLVIPLGGEFIAHFVLGN